MIAPGSFWNAQQSRDVVFHAEGAELEVLFSGISGLRIFGVGVQRSDQRAMSYAALRKGHTATLDEIDKWRAGLRIARVVNHEEARFFLRGRTEAFVVEDDTRAK